ncbi:MAG TPA: hypothetical protein VFK03_01050, partial [Candidatus Saccharimonadales bacterium]|nr:hypothetical protein [Candidatus Saccharimonadales bacterium]
PEDFRSWELAKEMGAVAMTDIADGWFGRRGKPSPASAALDEQVDKAVYHIIMNSLGMATGDKTYNTLSGLTLIRDMLITQDRKELRLLNLQAGARNFGKAKTWSQLGTITADLSPIGDRYPRTIKTMHFGAVALSGISYAEFKQASHKAKLKLYGELGLTEPADFKEFAQATRQLIAERLPDAA